jgi:hypothetical protein
MTIRSTILNLLGLGHTPKPVAERPVVKDIETAIVEDEICKAVERHKVTQTRLQVSTLNDLDTALGARLAVKGVLDRLERNKPK